jgi:8-oxo-dGTP pyrophosphatase MutT (NUDIX family)
VNTPELHKVAILCFRENSLLVFEHDHGGIQIPAGTVEPGEDPAIAAIRELAEESGVSVSCVTHLFSLEERGDPDEGVVAAYVPLLAQPDPAAAVVKKSMWRTWVRLHENLGEYTRVSEEKWNFDVHPPIRIGAREGFVLTSTLRSTQQRHIFRAAAPPAAPAGTWELLGDGDHIFRCRWAPLNKTGLIAGQQAWLDRAREILGV